MHMFIMCSDMNFGGTCRQREESEGGMLICWSLWHTPVSFQFSTLTKMQAGMSHNHMCMYSICNRTDRPTPCLQFTCTHTDALRGTRWWHHGQPIWHPEMSNMWPWEEQWTTDREGRKALCDEREVSSRSLISLASSLSVSMVAIHITIQHCHFNTSRAETRD